MFWKMFVLVQVNGYGEHVTTKTIKLTDLATYRHVKILKWAERRVRTFDNRIQKRIVDGSFGKRRPAGRPRNGWEDEVSKDVVIFLNTKKKKNCLTA